MKTKHYDRLDSSSVLTFEQKARIAQLIEDGHRLIELTRRTGINHTTLRRLHRAFRQLPDPRPTRKVGRL